MTLTRHVGGFYDPSPADPVGVVAPLLDRTPRWLVVGGLGDGNEAQAAARRWPGVRVVGVDVDPRAVAYQKAHGWRAEWPLVQAALAARAGVRRANMDSLNCASLHRSMLAACPPESLATVAATTLDALEAEHGPFDDCVLWLDLEGLDCEAARGAEGLLKSGRVLLVNAETRYEHEGENRELSAWMEALGYCRAYVWFRQWWGHNEVWLPRARVRP